MPRVHIQGSGTIGGPLVHLLSEYDRELGLDEVTFTKNTPRLSDLPRVEKLQDVGGTFVVEDGKRDAFEDEGFVVDGSLEDTLEEAAVIIEATPSGVALDRKPDYEAMDGPKGFLAQGSESGFGMPYAARVNDDELDELEERFVHIVSCNTHNIAALVRAIALREDGPGFERGSVVCIRRGTDVGQRGDAPLAPKVSIHDAPEGTHHAHDVIDLYETTGRELELFSSAIKVPTQFMHTIWFQFELAGATDVDEVLDRLVDDPLVAVTDKDTSNLVFNVGREFGPFGRLLNQGVVAKDSLHVEGQTVTGFCFTPQDGNALLSNVAATTRFVHPEDWRKRCDALNGLIYNEI